MNFDKITTHIDDEKSTYICKLEDDNFHSKKQYQNSIVLKLINERMVLAYNWSQEEESKRLEVKNIQDNNKFLEDYINQEQKDEFFFNFKGKLFISIKTHVFIYDYETNKIVQFSSMADNHKGGSFIYVSSNSSLYCISGLYSYLVEKVNIDKYSINSELSNYEWTAVNKLPNPRAYYSHCVLNESVIYLLFGFNLHDLEYVTTLEKYDTNNPFELWKTIKIKGNFECPKHLTFTGLIVNTEEDVLVLGGKDEHNNDNDIIYTLNTKNGRLEDTKMRLPIVGEIVLKYDNKNLFYQEPCFLPLLQKEESNNIKDRFFCGFDSKHCLHLVNVSNFDYTYIEKEIGSLTHPSKERQLKPRKSIYYHLNEFRLYKNN